MQISCVEWKKFANNSSWTMRLYPTAGGMKITGTMKPSALCLLLVLHSARGFSSAAHPAKSSVSINRHFQGDIFTPMGKAFRPRTPFLAFFSVEYHFHPALPQRRDIHHVATKFFLFLSKSKEFIKKKKLWINFFIKKLFGR